MLKDIPSILNTIYIQDSGSFPRIHFFHTLPQNNSNVTRLSCSPLSYMTLCLSLTEYSLFVYWIIRILFKAHQSGLASKFFKNDKSIDLGSASPPYRIAQPANWISSPVSFPNDCILTKHSVKFISRYK